MWRLMGHRFLIRHKATLNFRGGFWLGKELGIITVDVNLLVDMDYFSVSNGKFLV